MLISKVPSLKACEGGQEDSTGQTPTHTHTLYLPPVLYVDNSTFILIPLLHSSIFPILKQLNLRSTVQKFQ